MHIRGPWGSTDADGTVTLGEWPHPALNKYGTNTSTYLPASITLRYTIRYHVSRYTINPTFSKSLHMQHANQQLKNTSLSLDLHIPYARRQQDDGIPKSSPVAVFSVVVPYRCRVAYDTNSIGPESSTSH